MQTRRKFLERSALGAGSILFSATLLQSCIKDHLIPNPEGPTIMPPLGEDYGGNFSWNDDAKIVVTTALGMVPEAGEILSGLVDIFWPSDKPNIWDQVKEQVEALMNQKIDALVYQQVTEDLQGLNNSLTLYLNELKNGSPGDIKQQWTITRNLFVNALPHFQSAGYEVLLLPLFAQFVNMYFSLLRDGVLFGLSWGMTTGDNTQVATDLQTAIPVFVQYTAETYNNIGRVNVVGKTKRNDQMGEPFRSINIYDRQMTLTVLDFMNSWFYFDSTRYPDGPDELLGREIYSDPFGSYGNSTPGTPISIQSYPGFPSNITVWASDRVDAAQLTYNESGTISQTPRMGVQAGGKTAGGSPSKPYSVDISPNNPITKVRVWTGQYPDGGLQGPFASAFQFQFNDNTTSNTFGSLRNAQVGYSTDTGMFGYPGEALSSIYIHGFNNLLGGADSVVFGFKYWQSPQATLRAISALYVKSPAERSEADFHKAFPHLGISAGSITDELKTVRQAYWAAFEAHAKTLK